MMPLQPKYFYAHRFKHINCNNSTTNCEVLVSLPENWLIKITRGSQQISNLLSLLLQLFVHAITTWYQVYQLRI